MQVALKAITVVLLLAACAAPGFAQPQPGAQRGGGKPGRGAARGDAPGTPGVSPGDVQKMFDAYTLMQAQEQLKIGEEQFAKFMPRFKALQETRRKNQTDRGQIIVDLRRLSVATPMDEAQVKEKLRALQDVEGRAAADEKKSYESIDQVLDLKQQAQFRVFEEVMERRKMEMISRARASRARGTKPPQQ